MSIIGSLPVNLANGTEADASQVMTDLNFIVNAVNANAQPAGSYSTAGTLDAPSGTRMPFHQAAAPTGWVVDTTISNHTCLYTTTGGQNVTGTASGYTQFLLGQWSTDGHTLNTSELPPHSHNFPLTVPSGSQSGPATQNGGSFSGSFTTDNGTGGSQPHAHSISANWKYISLCIAQKS